MPLSTCAGCTTRYAPDLAACPNCRSTELAGSASPPMLPTVSVACDNPVCTYHQVPRQVRLQPAAPGVLAAPPLLCGGCGWALSQTAPWLPEEDQMAKITRHGGASDARAQDPADAPPARRRDTPADTEPVPAADTAPQAAAEPAEPAPVPEPAQEPAVAAEPEPAATAPAKTAAKPRAPRARTRKAAGG